MARVSDPNSRCESCAAPFAALVLGGVGSWRDKIVCAACLTIKGGFPADYIARLVADQYGISLADALAADATSQAEYEQIALGGAPFDDLPTVPPTTRWHARRLARQ